VIRRLFALLILLGLVAGGLYYWKFRPETPKELVAVRDTMRDAAVKTGVKTAFSLNRSLGGLGIQVETEDAVVTLRGAVPDDATRQLAEVVAGSVPEVSRVVNQLVVKVITVPSDTSRSMGEVLDDEALEAKVRLALSLNRTLEGNSISVKAFRKEVQLSGEVRSEAQRATALQVVQQVPGVASVTESVKLAPAPQ
jgi:osmotically-inducible protein OsmY